LPLLAGWISAFSFECANPMISAARPWEEGKAGMTTLDTGWGAAEGVAADPPEH